MSIFFCNFAKQIVNMAKQKNIELDFEIDKITNSIENTVSGESFPTVVLPVTKEDLAGIKNDATWLFDWNKENRTPKRRVLKLTTIDNPQVIQGLICFEMMSDHVFMHLIESAHFNRGATKLYRGVMGNLVAYACKVSFQRNFDGYVSFTAKTKLIEHYEKTLGAQHFGKQLMIVDTIAAKNLIEKYFKNYGIH